MVGSSGVGVEACCGQTPPPIPAVIAVDRPQRGRSSLILAYISGLLSHLSVVFLFSVLLASTAFSKVFLNLVQESSIELLQLPFGLHLYFEFDTYQRMSWSNISLKTPCWILGHSMLCANYLISKPQLASGTYSFWGLHSANMWCWHHWHCIQRFGMARQPSLRGPCDPEEGFCLQK